MHIEKGVFESTIGLLLDIPSKTKNGLSAHKDLQALEIREELHPQERPNGKAYRPPASYTVTTEEKRAICKCLHGIRVPTGISTNIKNMVSMSELKMSGYNTHDCHTLLSLFLAITTKAVNHPYLKMVSTCMCHFFNAISKKVIDISELDELCKEIRVTMCQLEMYFPPSFFDKMEHYMIHLADQIFVLGPSYMHYRYIYKHHMVVTKGYVHNRAHPEGSMIEGYTTEEVVECYTDSNKDGKPIGVPVSQHHGRLSGKGTIGVNYPITTRRRLWPVDTDTIKSFQQQMAWEKYTPYHIKAPPLLAEEGGHPPKQNNLPKVTCHIDSASLCGAG
jgi:hypothetical protein